MRLGIKGKQVLGVTSIVVVVVVVLSVLHLARLAKDLRVINLTGHEFAAKAMDEVGRMAGGWLKSTRQKHEADR